MSLEIPKKREEGPKGMLSNFGKKTRRLAKVLAFSAALSIGCDSLPSEKKERGPVEDKSEAVQIITDNEQERIRIQNDLIERPQRIFREAESIIPMLSNPERVFELAGQRSPRDAVVFAYKYKVLENAEKIVHRAVRDLMDLEEWGELTHAYESYKEYPFAENVLKACEKENSNRNPEILLENAHLLSGKEYAQGFLETAFKGDPYLSIKYGNHYIDQDISPSAYEEKEDDRKYKLGMKVINAALEKSKDPAVKIIKDLNAASFPVEEKKKMSLLLQDFASGKISFEEASSIIADDSKFFTALVGIKTQAKPLAELAVRREIKEMSLKKIERINRLHEEVDSERFKSVDGMDSGELYALMVYGEEEVFTSTFNGLFGRFIEKMKNENVSGGQLMESMHHDGFRIFIKMSAGFNKLNDFLDTMEMEQKKDLLKKFVQNIEKEPDMLSQAVGIADTFSSVKNKEILKIMQNQISREYQRVQGEGNKKGMVLYGLLASLFEGKIIIDDDWLCEAAKRYKLPSLEKISSPDLFGRDGANIQQYFFYDDEDGRGSFNNFINQYKEKSKWRIERKENYIIIKSVAKNNGKRIEIFANFPDKEREGPADIEKELQKRNIQSIVIVHRGHSYHAQKTIERIPRIAKIVSLGSCGGYNNINAVLKKAPGAHIISTKSVGTRHINDPMFRMLNEEIISGKDIVWSDFWKKVENKLEGQKDFGSYVPPHKNLGALFIKVYNEIMKGK